MESEDKDFYFAYDTHNHVRPQGAGERGHLAPGSCAYSTKQNKIYDCFPQLYCNL